MNLDLARGEAVAQQFLAHVGRGHEQAVEAPVQPDLPALGQVADPAEGEAAAAPAGDRGAAGENAIDGGAPVAGPAGEVVVLVSAQAIHVVVVHHPDDGRVGEGEGLEHPGAGDLVHEDQVRPETGAGALQAGHVLVIQGEALAKRVAPLRLGRRGAPMGQAHGMPATGQGLGGGEDVGLGAAERSHAFMDKEDAHCVRDSPGG